MTLASDSAMPRATRFILWAYLVFNLAIALSLLIDPASVDATYRGGIMTPTRRFLWWSIGSFHLLVVGVTFVSLRLRHAAERRWLHFLNGAFYLWDALTEWTYFGSYLGVAPLELHRNAGLSAVCGLLLIFAFAQDRASTAPS